MKSEKHANRLIDEFEHKLLYRKIQSSRETAIKMFELFDQVIDNFKWSNLLELNVIFKNLGERLANRDRMNFVVRNCFERMMKIIKNLSEEYHIQITNSAFPQYHIESLN